MAERRNGNDRRAKPTPPMTLFSVMGRRWQYGRRDVDKPGYVDLYHPVLFFILIMIIMLSLADAYLTLDALSGGCREVNPIMNAALGLGKQSFVFIKTLVTGLGIALLCMHKAFPRVRWIILIVLMGYVALIGYHVHLMQFR